MKKKWLQMILAIILIAIGVPLALSSLYFIAEPLPHWLEDNTTALFLYTTSLGNNIYVFASQIIGYLLVAWSMYIVEKVDEDSPGFNKKDSLKKSLLDYL